MDTSSATAIKDPYVGFQSLDESRARSLGGRDAEIAAIDANLHVAALTILYGPSGVGKTSILRAGVIPTFDDAERASEARESGQIVPFYFDQWQQPDFARALNAQVIASLPWGEGPPPFEAHTPLDAIITAWGRRTGGAVVLIFDQFEEYLTNTPPESTQKLPAWGNSGQITPDGAPPPVVEHDHFDRVLARLVNRRDVPANVLLSIREDEVFRLDRFRLRIPHLMANSMRIDPLTDAQAQETLRKALTEFNEQAAQLDPAAVVHIPEGDDPIEEVVREASRASGDRPSDHRIEPAFLQVAMQELWNHEAESWKASPGYPRQLRKSVLVERLGGTRAVIEQYVDKKLSTTLSRRELPIASRAFAELISPRGEKIPMFATQLAMRIEPWASRQRLRRYFGHERRDQGAQEELPSRAAAVLGKLERASVLRKIPPDRYDVFHQVLSAPLKRWHQRFEAHRLKRNWAWSGAIAAIVTVGIGLSFSSSFAAQQFERRLKRFNDLYASVIPTKDPGLMLTLAAYAYRTNPTATARARVASALESADGWLIGHTGQVSGVDFSDDGSTLASAGADSQALLWDTSTYALKGRIRQSNPVNAAVFRPGSTELVTVSDDRTVRVWNLPWLAERGDSKSPPREAQLVHEFTPQKDSSDLHTDEIWTAAFSANGRYLLTGGKDKQVKIWDMESRSLYRSFAMDYEVVASTFSPDHIHAAVGGLGTTVDLLNIRTGDTRSLAGHTDYVYGLTYTADGARLASSSSDGSVILWDAATGNRERTFTSGARLWGLAILGRGSTIAASSRDGSLVIWDSQSSQAVTEFSGRAEVLTAMSRSPNFDLLAAGSLRGAIRLFRISPRVLVDGQISNLAFSSRGDRLIAATTQVDSPAPDTCRCSEPGAAVSQARPKGERASAVLWAISDAHLKAPLKSPTKDDEIESVASDAAGERFVTGSRNGRVTVWSWDGSHEPPLTAGAANVQAVAISRDGQRFAAGDWQGQVKVWDRQPDGFREVDAFKVNPIGRVSALAFSPEGSHLAIGWGDVRTAVQVRDLSSQSTTDLSVAGALKVLSLAFSVTGGKLAAGFEDGSLIVWRSFTGGNPGMREPPRVMIGHNSSITTVDFDSSGLRLASGSRDKTARVWAVESADLEVTIPAQEAVAGVRFLPDGRLMLVDVAGNTKVQDLNWDHLAVIAAARGRPLVEWDCNLYFAGPCPNDLRDSTQVRASMRK